MVKLTGIASHTLGSVPWSLNVPQPKRAYSVNKNDRLLSIMMVIWSVAISSDSLVYFEEKYQLTFENLARLIHLVPHLPHIVVAKVTVRSVANLDTASSGQEVVRPTESISIQTGQELRGRVAVEVGQAEGVGCDIPPRSEP
jgi:hypothetical protein